MHRALDQQPGSRGDHRQFARSCLRFSSASLHGFVAVTECSDDPHCRAAQRPRRSAVPPANRKFKPPPFHDSRRYRRSGKAVHRTVLGEIPPLGCVFELFIGPRRCTSTLFDRWVEGGCEPDHRFCCRTVFALRIRPPGTAPAAAPVSGRRARGQAQMREDPDHHGGLFDGGDHL